MRAIIWKDFRTIVYHPQKLLIINAALLGLVIWLGIFKGDILNLKTSDSTFLLFLMPSVMLMNVYQFSFQLIYSEK